MFTTISDRLFPTTKSNQCPICGDVSGKCRTKDNEEQAVLCAGSSNARKGDKEGSYTCVNDKGKGHTTHIWILTNDDYSQWTDDRKTAYELEKKRRELIQQQERQRKLESEVPLIERDRINRIILDQLTLTEEDKQHLLDRGFTLEQINQHQFKSVEPYHKVSLPDVAYNFPGLIVNGFGNTGFRKLCITGKGILCPIYQDGYIVAFKIRFTTAKNGQRYSSVSNKTNSFHIYGEQPIAVLLNTTSSSKGVFITEGSEIKPVLIHLKYGLPVLGGARYWYRSPNHSDKYLPLIRERFGNKIVLCPDAGDIINEQVYPHWFNEAEYFLSQGFDVSFAWFNQVTKDASDIDELKSLDDIQYLSLEEFRKIVDKYNNEDFKQWDESRKFTATAKINQPEFSFPANSVPAITALVAVKSPLGSGKTLGMIEVMKTSGNRSFLLGCLNNLLLQTNSRAADKGLQIYHLHLDEASNLIADINTNIAACVDSMHHLDGHFVGTDLFIDEVDSVIKGIVSGGTLGDRQGYIMTVFEKAIQECNRVFTFDANNSDLLTNFIHSIAPDKQVVKIENVSKPKPQVFKFVEGFDPSKNKLKKHDKSAIVKLVLDEKIKPFIASDSKNLINSLDTLLKDTKKGLTLTSDTVNEPFAKEFLKDPDKFLKDNPVDYFAISPSANSGISITNRDCFTDKVSIFTGVLTTNQQTQLLARLRPTELAHYVFCPEFTLIHNNADYPTVEAYKAKTLERLWMSAQKAAPYNTDSMLRIASSRIEELKDNKWFKLSSELATADNYERNNLKKCLIYSLEKMGHKVEIIGLEVDEGVNGKLKEVKEKIIKIQAEEIYNAIPLKSVNEAYQLAKSSPVKSMKRRIEKTILLDRMPGLVDTEYFTVDLIEQTLSNRNFLSQHEIFYRLTNPELSRLKSEVNWFYKATNEFNFLLPLVSDIHLKVEAFSQLNLLQFLDGRLYYKNSPEVIEFYNKALNNPDIALALGMKVAKPTASGKERIDLVRRCLKSIGIQFKYEGKPLIDGKQHYTYKVDTEELNNPERLAILEAIARRYDNWVKSESVAKVNWQPKPVEVVTTAKPVVLNETMIDAEGCIAFLEENINTLTYEEYKTFINPYTDEIMELVDLYLNRDVKEKLKALMPTTAEGNLIHKLLEAEKKGIEVLNNVVKEVLNIVDSIPCVLDMLPIRLRELVII